MHNEEPIQLIKSANNPCIDFLRLNMSLDATTLTDNTEIEAEHAAIKQRLKDIASSLHLYTRKGKRHWQELVIKLLDDTESTETTIIINLDPYRYSKSSDKFGHNFFSITISSGFTKKILQQIIEILQEVLGIHFDKLRQHARVSRIDLAFDFEMDLSLIHISEPTRPY